MLQITSGHLQIAQAKGYSNELELWAATRCGHLLPKRSSDDHMELCDAFYDLVTGKIPHNRLSVNAYRAMGKTRWLGPIAMPWLICETNIELIQLIARSGGASGLSTQIAKRVRQELMSPVIQHDYGIRVTKGSEAFTITRPDGSMCEFYCRGKRSGLRGNRGMVIFEDIQNEDDVKSETVLERDEEWFFSDAINVPGPDDPVLWISNYISPVALAAKIEMLEDWTVLKFYAENPPHSGKSSWPVMYSDDYLAMKRRELGQDRYNADYLLEPRVSGNPVFKKEWFRQYRRDEPRYLDMLQSEKWSVLGYDGSDSEATSADETAIVVLRAEAYKSEPDVYVERCFGTQTSMGKGLDKVFELADRFNVNESIIESRVKEGNIGPQEEYVTKKEAIEGTTINATYVKPEKDKVTRALYVQGYVQRGKVHFDLSDAEQQKLLTQLILFTGEQLAKDDRVDAFVHAMTALLDWIKRVPHVAPAMQYDEVTGRPMHA